jgi:hypothetical protein
MLCYQYYRWSAARVATSEACIKRSLSETKGFHRISSVVDKLANCQVLKEVSDPETPSASQDSIART